LFLRELPENIGWNLGENHWQTNTVEWVEAARNVTVPIEGSGTDIEVTEKPAKEIPPKEESEKGEREYEKSDTHEISFV
ncbi:hypothetical protein, partial [Escherichia coli]|uniref:hypothetical protein n=1 Tax=Escherichia coli TaxID=562 RepID=UPI0021C72CB1